MSEAFAALVAGTAVALLASLGALDTEGGNKVLPTVWIVLAICWVAFISVRLTLIYTQ